MKAAPDARVFRITALVFLGLCVVLAAGVLTAEVLRQLRGVAP